MLGQNEKMISLKEAAEISGYAPDYIGQLIRSGKLPGKQVFSNVAWVTTEQAIRDYMDGKKTSKSDHQSDMPFVSTLGDAVIRELETPRLLRVAISVAVFFAAATLLLLFYVFSTSLDQQLSQRAVEQVSIVE